MNSFFPATGSEAEWNAAYYRLEDYLRALHVVNKVHQSQIILDLLRDAAAKHAVNPDRHPTELALEEACVRMDEWFKRILPGQDDLSVAGRVSLLIADATEKWPTVFLSEDIPADFAEAMRESKVQAGPDLQVSSMVPRPLDAGSPPFEASRPAIGMRWAWIIPTIVFCSLLVLMIVRFLH
jgi:hypothetical protein